MIGLAVLILAAATAPEPATRCTPVELSAADKALATKTRVVRQIRANFAKAYSRACAEGLLKRKRLIGVQGANAGRLFLLNAPAADVASIYASGGRMILEYPFISQDGKTHVPRADELHEAIYCAVVGATEAEQEESGRCLPD